MLFLFFSVFLVAGLDLAVKFDSFVVFLVTDNVVVFA
jgi:sRNA-binding regulator protein Hfq